uniref:U650k n=1 Tax=Mycobacterium leprae TaxID=1769 RepID=Q50102_MYCLR|nr:u650k [Mycobacterium leprae]
MRCMKTIDYGGLRHLRQHHRHVRRDGVW